MCDRNVMRFSLKGKSTSNPLRGEKDFQPNRWRSYPKATSELLEDLLQRRIRGGVHLCCQREIPPQPLCNKVGYYH